MGNFKERLMTFVKAEYREGQKAFEERCGLSNGQINKMSNGTNTTTLCKIAEVCPQLNLRWLLLGDGDMLVHQEPVSSAPSVNMENVQAVFITNVDAIASAVAKVLENK